MTVESATYLSTLNPTFPLHNDPLSETDSHIRLLKAVLQATFPNLTGPVTLTQAQLNAAVLNTGGQTISGTTTFVNQVTTGTGTFSGATSFAGAMGVTAPFVTTSSVTVGGAMTVFGAANFAAITGTSVAIAGNIGLTGTLGAGTVTATVQVNAPSIVATGSGLIATGGQVQGNAGFFTGTAGTTPATFIGEIRLLNNAVAVPTGWQLCNGTNGAPNLISVSPAGTAYIQRLI